VTTVGTVRLTKARQHVLGVPWEERQWAERFGARWAEDVRRWVINTEQLPDELLPYASKPFSWERWIEDDINSGHDVVPPALSPEPQGSVVLRGYQQTGTETALRAWLAGYPGFLIADETGIGKTLEAVQTGRLMKTGRALVICPLSAIPVWRAAIPELDVHGRIRWCVLNYESSKKLLVPPARALQAKRQRTRNRRISKDGTSRVNWDLVICDEAHRLGNPVSQQSSVVRRLTSEADQDRGRRPFVLWLSATAGQDPLKLSYLAPLLGAVTGKPVRDLADFGRWCSDQGIAIRKAAFGSWEWAPDSEEQRQHDLFRMKQLLYDYPVPAAIRRHPEDIAGWPKQQRVAVPVELGAAAQRLYRQAWLQFRQEMQLAHRGRNPADRRAAYLRFRQKASLLKVPAVVQLAKDALEDGYQPAVSFEFLESAEAFVDQMGAEPVAVITGDVKGDAREQQRLRFQRGEARVVVFTITEAISLHAGEQLVGGNNTRRKSIVADVRRSAIQQLQIEGRTHRDGQLSISYMVYATGTVEKTIIDRAIQRMNDLKTMQGDVDIVDLETILSMTVA